MNAWFLVIDKPAGITSHDVVAAVRAVTGIKKVGHTGTLDPFATGVLPLALGPATRLIQFVDESIKVYDATIALGTATDTGDPTGTVIREAPVPQVSRDELLGVLQSFVGDRMQAPPAYSAVKHGGKPLYHYARRGETVTVPARPITIHGIELLEHTADRIRVMITCSRGTYARVLADDIATALGSAGHLEALQRPRSGPFYLDDALSMPRLAQLATEETERPWQDVLLARGRNREDRVRWRPRDEVLKDLTPWLRRPIDVLSHLPLADVRPPDAARIRKGGTPPPPPAGVAVGSKYLIVCGDELLGVAEVTIRGPRLLKGLEAD